MNKQCSIAKLKIDDNWSRMSYGRVTEQKRTILGHKVLVVENEDKVKWEITGEIFEAEFQIAGQYNEIQKVTKTKLIEVFLSNPRVVMQLAYYKKLDIGKVKEKLKELYPNKGIIKSKVDYERTVEELLDNHINGELREITGRHYCKESNQSAGRYYFIDMKVEKEDGKENRIRLVDADTIEWIIVDNIKYEKK